MIRSVGGVSTMTLRLPDELDDDLRAAAEAAHMSINSFVIEVIRTHLESVHHESVMSVARAVIARDAEILDRLANA